MTSLNFSFLDLEMGILRVKLQGYKDEKGRGGKCLALLKMWVGELGWS